MGPVAGALIELVKILLNLLIRGTSTAGVGDLGNFLIGCAMCIPASLIYQFCKRLVQMEVEYQITSEP